MSFHSPEVTAWLRDHHGVVSTTALERFGVTLDERRYLVRKGVLRRVVHGAYRYAGAPETLLQRCAAVCLARTDPIVGIQTAAVIWGVPGIVEDVERVAVLAPHGAAACAARWLRIHRTDVLPAEDPVRRADGIVLTGPPRTRVDLAQELDDEELAACIEFILARRLCTRGTLRRVAARLDVPKRTWVGRFLTLLDGRMPGGPRESRWEQRVMAALRRRGVTDVVSQVRQRLPGYGVARFDLAIEPIRWVLEVDVHPSHRLPSGQARDHQRDRDARRSGWLTDRVGEVELRTRFEATIDDVVQSIAHRRAEVAALQAAGLWVA